MIKRLRKGDFMDEKRFMTIRQVAKLGILPEHRLRMMCAQDELPGIRSGRTFLVNVPLLLEHLDELSRR